MAKELFNNRTFTLVWLAQAASGLGHTFAAFILSWLVYELTGSKVAMGSIWLCYMLPNLAVQLLAGPFLDRFGRFSPHRHPHDAPAFVTRKIQESHGRSHISALCTPSILFFAWVLCTRATCRLLWSPWS